MFRKELERVKLYVPGKPIEEVKNELGLNEVYKLASNENPFVPNYIKKAILKEIENINRYPQGDCFYLREKLAKRLGVDKDQLIFGNGSDEIINFVNRALIDKDDEVIIADPTFLIYEIQANICGAKVIKVPLKNYRYDLMAMADKISKKTKLIFIANPDNPTGSYVNQKEVERFLEVIPKDVLVYFDEAYFEFAPKKDFPNSQQFLKERGNIIFARTFSKIYSLAGLRLGYGVTSKDIIKQLDKVRDPFNINRFAQVAGLAALENDKFIKASLEYLSQEKQYLYKELKKLKINFFESATNFIFIKFGQQTQDLCNYLLEEGIVVRGLAGWGYPEFFRVTVGKHKENKKFIDILKIYLNK